MYPQGYVLNFGELLMSDEEMKRAAKEAIKEWMDEQFAKLGKWGLTTFLILIVGGLTMLILHANGWHK